MRHKKGFTLIELLVVLGIMGIVMTAISSYFLGNIKSFRVAMNQFETQHESAMAIEDVFRQIMESTGVEDHDKTKNLYKFKIEDESGNEAILQYKYNPDKKTLGSIWDGETKTICSNINKFTVDLLDMDNTKYTSITSDNIEASYGVRIFVEAEYNGSIVNFNNTVYFRNK